MSLHRNLTYADIHVAQSLEYADATARTGATGLVAADVGRIAKQNDDSSFWVLTSHSPVTWLAIGAGGSVPMSRTLTAGAGLTGGGDLTADRTFNVVADADGSISVAADSIKVGILASDAQHGSRGGGSQHAAATTSVAGFLSAADKTKLDGLPTIVQKTFNEVSVDTTTTSTSFVTLMSRTLTVTAGNTLLAFFSASASNSSNNRGSHYRLLIGGVAQQGCGMTSPGSNNPNTAAMMHLETGLAGGSLAVEIQWKVGAGTGQIRPVTAPSTESAALLLMEVKP